MTIDFLQSAKERGNNEEKIINDITQANTEFNESTCS